MNHAVANTEPDVAGLIKGYQPGFSLDAQFYTSESIFRKDLDKILFCNWIYAGHVSQLAEPGCYFLFELAEESIIIVRGVDATIRAFANVCRHRGSRICTGATGKVKAFVCPYHAWAYELDGRLRSRRAMPVEFDQSNYGLKPVRADVFHGLIFINLDTNAPDLADGLAAVDSSYSIYQLEKTSVACQESYTVDANWKLAIENFMECYHCAPAHAEYARCHTLKSPKDNKALRPAMLAEASRLGYSTDAFDHSQPAGTRFVQFFYNRNALYDPYVTGSQDGQPVAPMLGSIGQYGGGVADIQIGPVSFGILYPDHAVLYRFVPRGVQKTDMDIIWLVNASAEEGKDYDVDELTWMWRVTTEADKRIILNNQKGVNSRFYEQGPLSDMEDFTAGFIKWYLAQIQ